MVMLGYCVIYKDFNYIIKFAVAIGQKDTFYLPIFFYLFVYTWIYKQEQQFIVYSRTISWSTARNAARQIILTFSEPITVRSSSTS